MSITPLSSMGLYRFNYEHYHGGTKKDGESSDSPVRLSGLCDIVTRHTCHSGAERARLRGIFGDSLWKTWDREGWITSDEFCPFIVAKCLERRIELTSIIASSILCLDNL